MSDSFTAEESRQKLTELREIAKDVKEKLYGNETSQGWLDDFCYGSAANTAAEKNLIVHETLAEALKTLATSFNAIMGIATEKKRKSIVNSLAKKAPAASPLNRQLAVSDTAILKEIEKATRQLLMGVIPYFREKAWKVLNAASFSEGYRPIGWNAMFYESAFDKISEFNCVEAAENSVEGLVQYSFTDNSTQLCQLPDKDNLINKLKELINYAGKELCSSNSSSKDGLLSFLKYLEPVVVCCLKEGEIGSYRKLFDTAYIKTKSADNEIRCQNAAHIIQLCEDLRDICHLMYLDARSYLGGYYYAEHDGWGDYNWGKADILRLLRISLTAPLSSVTSVTTTIIAQPPVQSPVSQLLIDVIDVPSNTDQLLIDSLDDRPASECDEPPSPLNLPNSPEALVDAPPIAVPPAAETQSTTDNTDLLKYIENATRVMLKTLITNFRQQATKKIGLSPITWQSNAISFSHITGFNGCESTQEPGKVKYQLMNGGSVICPVLAKSELVNQVKKIIKSAEKNLTGSELNCLVKVLEPVVHLCDDSGITLHYAILKDLHEAAAQASEPLHCEMINLLEDLRSVCYLPPLKATSYLAGTFPHLDNRQQDVAKYLQLFAAGNRSTVSYSDNKTLLQKFYMPVNPSTQIGGVGRSAIDVFDI